jgi:hypothetical protein
MATGTLAILVQSGRIARLRARDWVPAVASALLAVAAGAAVLSAMEAAAGFELLAVAAASIATYALSTLVLEGRRALTSARMLARTVREGREAAVPMADVWEGAERET